MRHALVIALATCMIIGGAITAIVGGAISISAVAIVIHTIVD